MKRLDNVFPPPPIEQEIKDPPPVIMGGAGTSAVVLGANLFLTIVIWVSLYYGGHPNRALAVATGYFLLTTVLFLMTTTQAAPSMWREHQREKTKRRYIEAMETINLATLEPRAPIVERRAQLQDTRNFVPAFSQRAQQQAKRFSESLYTRSGEPNPRRVLMDTEKLEYYGMIKCKMCAEIERDYLVDAGVLRQVRGGFCLNIQDFPTVDHLRRVL